ncbi:MAG: hypothetical protein ACYDB9_02045 [Gammaproteobacteria bacterium]
MDAAAAIDFEKYLHFEIKNPTLPPAPAVEHGDIEESQFEGADA